MFQRFVFNLRGKSRYADLEGRRHLVVSAGIIGDDVVMEGSGGKIFYPKEENAKNPGAWNGMPLVVYHPEMNGLHVSARNPDVYNTRKVGVILNTVHDGKLKTECWFDEERTKAVDERVYTAVLNEEQMEVSTGLELDLEPTKGVHNSTEYTGIARNYRPDHLAVLPDKVGAYSIAMGGGLFANETSSVTQMTKLNDKAQIEHLPPQDFGDPAGRLFPIVNQGDLEVAAALIHHSADPTAVKRRLSMIAASKGLKVPETWVANELSYSSVYSMLSRLLGSTYGEKGKYWDGYIEELYPDRVIYCTAGGMYEVGYAQTGTSVSLKGDPVKVVRTTDYKPVANESVTVINKEQTTMAFDKKAHVTALITNGQYTEAQRPKLEALDDELLQGIAVVNKTPVAPPPAVTPPTPSPSEAEWLRTAPPNVVKQFNRLVANETAAKNAIITKLTANPKCKFTANFLAGKEVEELQGLLDMIEEPAQMVGNNGMYVNGYVPGGNYGFAGGAAPMAVNHQNLPEPDVLIMPDLFPPPAAAR